MRVGVEEVLPARGDRAKYRQEVLPGTSVGFAEIRAHECAVVLIQGCAITLCETVNVKKL